MNNKIIITIVLVFGIIVALSFYERQPKEKLFWDWFIKNEKAYYNLEENQEDEFNKLSKQLNRIDKNLTFEFSPIHKNGIREFIISADGLSESFPAVLKVVAQAPKIKNWRIHAFRQRIPGDGIKIKMGDTLSIGYEDIFFRYEQKDGKIGVELNIKDYVDSPNLNNAIYILMDGLIGEYDMETQISWIERKKLDETKIGSLFKLVELRDIVDTNKKENKK